MSKDVHFPENLKGIALKGHHIMTDSYPLSFQQFKCWRDNCCFADEIVSVGMTTMLHHLTITYCRIGTKKKIVFHVTTR